MKLGTQTGSLTNHLYSRMTKDQPRPHIGMGVTLLSWTDRHAATITHVWKKGKYTYINTAQDTAKRIDSNGMSECQEYEYKMNILGAQNTFRCELPDGKWEEVYINRETGRWKKYNGGKGLRLGVRESYHDYSF